MGLQVAQRKLLDRVIFLMPPLFVNEMGYVTQYEWSRNGEPVEAFGLFISTDWCFFRELLNWIHEQDLCFYLNRLDKLLTKVGPPQIALAWIRTPLVDWKRLLHICYLQRTKLVHKVKLLRRVHNPFLLLSQLLLQLVEDFGLLGDSLWLE